jgi:hypothetical protein
LEAADLRWCGKQCNDRAPALCYVDVDQLGDSGLGKAHNTVTAWVVWKLDGDFVMVIPSLFLHCIFTLLFPDFVLLILKLFALSLVFEKMADGGIVGKRDENSLNKSSLTFFSPISL